MSSVPNEVIKKLLDANYAPTTVALTLDIPLSMVLEVLPEQERRQYVEGEEMFHQAMRTLAFRAIEEAHRVFDEGTPAMKLALIKHFGSQVQKALGSGEKNPLDDLREKFTELMGDVREGRS